MTPEKHINDLGTLVSYFHTLEFLLRGFLKNQEKLSAESFDYTRIEAGDTVPVDSMTNFDSLGCLIKKYNSQVPVPNQITEEIVVLRDVIAHGRVCTSSDKLPLRIFKFDKPKGSQTTATYAANLDHNWFLENKNLVYDEINKVLELM